MRSEDYKPANEIVEEKPVKKENKESVLSVKLKLKKKVIQEGKKLSPLLNAAESVDLEWVTGLISE